MKKLRRCTCGGADAATRGAVDQAGTSRGDASASWDEPRDSGTEVAPDEHAVAGTASSYRNQSSASARRATVASAASSDFSDARNESDENESDGESDGNEDGACERCAAAFYAELEREMTAASKAYFGWTLKILTRAPLGGAIEDQKSRKSLRSWPKACGVAASRGLPTPSLRLGRRFVEASQDAPDLRGLHIDARTEARECLRWAELNATALRKILKKWDKTNASGRGRRALAAYWKRSEYQMLHSPVTMELRAVAGMLREGEDGPVWNTRGSFGSFGSVGEVAGGASAADDSGSDEASPGVTSGSDGTHAASQGNAHESEQPTCGVCLDTLYKPVGLECGHVFCRDCLLRAAGVLDHRGTSLAVSLRGRQTVSRVAAGEAALEPASWRARDKCPECRQSGVFLTSTRLRHVEACIKRLDPEGHRARRAESKRTWRDATKFAWGNMPKAVAEALKRPGGSSAALSLASFVVGVVVAVVAL